ncbi:MAG: hypothetical protein V1676_05915 [Candidatus Diapherotrites archaeon]
MGAEILGLLMIAASMVFAFYRKRNELGLALLIILFIVAYMLGYFGK